MAVTMAYTRSEVVLSTDPLRLARSPEARALAVAPWTPPTEEVVRISPAHRVPPRTQREWHRVFGADGAHDD